MAESIIKGITLKVIETIHPKASILIFTNSGHLSLYAEGIFNTNSKNRSNLILGSLVEVEYFRARLNNKMSKLKKVSILKEVDVTQLFNSLFIQKIIYIFDYITVKNNLVDIYEKLIDFIGIGRNSHILTILASYILTYNGYEPNFSKCSECGSFKNISDFEFYKGGYLCQNHSKNSISIEELEAYYWLRNDHKKYIEEVTPTINKLIYQKLINHLSEIGFAISWEDLSKFT
ncbi:DNA repair protein RecO C-terminal domain-containing protein [Mycoplasma crocodyli]|uniref:DNA repair protein RecO n=1 Tax=Mycoplasma crocodyli (strain ATCC 51981 / MP145) TaxID=512564 RepID=D5E4P9_MYCCM|nr:DNA repair protein RecO C-terminal domain-containing protein [Mycoplasma crocodyli]ADE19803.1 hypothetical protein MCRO_0061 [Mycoplasma crocodyli MP145]